jgi:hypothetical protein
MDRERLVDALNTIVQRLPENEVKAKLRGMLVSLRQAAGDNGLFLKTLRRFEKEVSRAAAADPLVELKQVTSRLAREVEKEAAVRAAS